MSFDILWHMFFFCLFFFFFFGMKRQWIRSTKWGFWEQGVSRDKDGGRHSVCLDPLKLLRFTFTFQHFFFFFFFVTLKRYYSSLLWTVAVTFDREQCICALFMDPQITLFNNFFIKNGSHGTIYTFKNYFATVFSVFSFQFQQNKFYPNRPIEVKVSDDTSQSENEED